MHPTTFGATVIAETVLKPKRIKAEKKKSQQKVVLKLSELMKS